MSNSQTKAELAPRFLAALVDSVIAGVLGYIIPVLGGILGAAYILTKESLMFEITKDDKWKNKSIGKYLFKIHVRSTQSDPIDWMTSIKRNWPLAIGSIVMIIPILRWILGPIFAVVFSLIELILVLTNPEGKRLGDRIAESHVVADAPDVQNNVA